MDDNYIFDSFIWGLLEYFQKQSHHCLIILYHCGDHMWRVIVPNTIISIDMRLFWVVLKPKSWIGLMHKLAILNRTTKTYYNTIPWVELVLQKKQVNQGGRRIIVKWHCRVIVWEAHGWKDLKLGFFHNFDCLIIYFAI